MIKGNHPLEEIENINFLKKASARVIETRDIVNGYKNYFGVTLSPKDDVNKMIIEFFNRKDEEGGKDVLFDLFYRKKLIENANVNFKKQLNNPFNLMKKNMHIWEEVENYLKCFEKDVI